MAVVFQQLNDKFDRLMEAEDELQSLLLEGTTKKEIKEYNSQCAEAEEFRELYVSFKVQVENVCTPPTLPKSRTDDDETSVKSTPTHVSNKSVGGSRKYKLPRLELKKFNGEVKEWLSFWGQFQKIHEDEELAPEDKFHYLAQSMVSGSRAASLVNSYPLTAINYPKAVKQLKIRFAREDLLVQVYVRELLGMVISNALSGRCKVNISDLYDRLESHLRALESLGRTQDKFADFLAPLVESCLPEDLLRAWERQRASEEIDDDDNKDTGKPEGNMLTKLMKFLLREVNGEEMIKLAKTGLGGFGSRSEAEKVVKKKKDQTDDLPTAASLFASSGQGTTSVRVCAFCSKGHYSSDCYQASKMSLAEKKRLIQASNSCFNCLKSGHGSRSCKTNVRCIICHNRHLPIMCPTLESSKSESSSVESPPKTKENKLPAGTNKSSCLTNQSQLPDVYLQTLQVKVSGRDGEATVMALIDSGSQRSYVHTDLVRRLRLEPTRKEKIVHCLFGKVSTALQEHDVFKINLSALEGSYECNFDTLEQNGICTGVPVLKDANSLRLLREEGISIPKYSGHSAEIELLIGADVAGKLLTGKIKSIGKGLTAVETRLGWTVLGKLPETRSSVDVVTAINLHVSDSNIANLWKLEVLGISDPHERKSQEDRILQATSQFQDTVKNLPDGRYQVGLPWRDDHPPLPSNKELAWKRHTNAVNKLEKDGKLQAYVNIFEEWQRNQIIEEVPADELHLFGHYLPHRPVIKEDSATTKMRPVFDASAHLKGEPSLNDSLEKGPNTIELIPDVLDRFRSQPIAVTADVEKAFLQLEVEPSQRDFLRFFHPSDGKVYRHRRVVFGVSSSPFLLGSVINHHLARMSDEYPETTEKLRRSFYVDNCVASVSSREELERFVSESKELMNRACLNLRGWVSNMVCEDVTTPSQDVPILGLLWNVELDTLRCNVSKLFEEESLPVTKRNILSITQRIFDPVGFTCPSTVFPKRILQEIWLLKVGWDEPLPEQFRERFEDWKRELPLLQQIEIPRYTGGEGDL